MAKPRKAKKRAPAKRPKKTPKRTNRPSPRSKRPVRVGKKHAPAPRLMGRPPILTVELSAEIVGNVADGNYVETAAALAGVDKFSIYEWLKSGARLQRTGREDFDEHERLLIYFSNAIKAAQALAETQAVRRVLLAKDWRAAAWWLERAKRDRYGKSETLRLGGAAPDSEGIDLTKLSTEELESWERLFSKATAAADEGSDDGTK